MISVLVAVYNAQEYICECLDSLLHQTYDDLQIICVDDASTDDSWKILQDYKNCDRRVETYRVEKNQGAAHARNVGLNHVRGDYVCFLDSDDYFAEDALGSALGVFETIPETDCVLFDVHIVDKCGNLISRQTTPEFISLTGLEAASMYINWKIHGVYMLKAGIHRRIPYDESARAYSDDITTPIHYLHSRKIGRCDGVYHYRRHPKSVTNEKSALVFERLRAGDRLRTILNKEVGPGPLMRDFENQYWLLIISMVGALSEQKGKISPHERKEAMTLIKDCWLKVDTTLLSPRNKWKFGYWPVRFSWRLFRLQQCFYHGTRRMKKGFCRNRIARQS